MKERGKAVEIYNNDSDFNYSGLELPCRKHHSSSSIGICAYCLKEKLVKLRITSGVFMDLESETIKSGFDPRKSGLRGGFDAKIGTVKKGVYPVKESDFSAMDESAFIDLNLDLSADPNQI
ncbi:unnamed protein product [Fraxinus pennsylvanica]|uniref:Uncharacterized protein n=1 Tax=Fraxinus pennsylvanica TaxID=56036 RepID=A0AAD2E1K6_9LAMI|nr:unnamed protein product [Fraxinus pennsylvanica]